MAVSTRVASARRLANMASLRARPWRDGQYVLDARIVVSNARVRGGVVRLAWRRALHAYRAILIICSRSRRSSWPRGNRGTFEKFLGSASYGRHRAFEYGNRFLCLERGKEENINGDINNVLLSSSAAHVGIAARLDALIK